jgi:hypothetical protein
MPAFVSRTAAVIAIALALVGVAWWRIPRWWNGSAPVPDHATTFSASQQLLFAGGTTLTQRVRPTRDKFAAVDAILSAESRGLPGSVRLVIQDASSGRVVREGRVPASSLPTGPAWDVRPSSPGERWVTFSFEPIADSAGKEFDLALSYPPPEGVDRPGSRLATLSRAPARYPFSEPPPQSNEAAGVLLVRLAARGTHGDAVHVGLDNIARAQPLGTGSLVASAVSLVVALCFAGGSVRALTRRRMAPA